MLRIIRANISRFRDLLKLETDPAKRDTLKCLLAEEEEKLNQEPKPVKKAY